MSILSKRTQHIEDDIQRIEKSELLERISLNLMRSYRVKNGYLMPTVMIIFFVKSEPTEQTPFALETRNSLFTFSGTYNDSYEVEYQQQLINHLIGITNKFGGRTTEDVKIMFNFHD